VPVGGLGNWCGNDNTSSVDSLPHVAPVDSPGDLLDQHWCESFGPQRLMNAQEVDLGLDILLAVDNHVHGDSTNEAKQLVFLASPDTEEPVLVIAWRSESPLQELDRVVKSEHIVIIFDVVLSQQVVHLLALLIVLDVDVVPRETGRDV